jgi:hypothetical protein
VVDADLQRRLGQVTYWVASWVQLEPERLSEAQDDPWVWERLEPSPMAQAQYLLISTYLTQDNLLEDLLEQPDPLLQQRQRAALAQAVAQGVAQALCMALMLDPATWARTMGPWLQTHGDRVAPRTPWPRLDPNGGVPQLLVALARALPSDGPGRPSSGVPELLAALAWYSRNARAQDSQRQRLVRQAVLAHQRVLWGLSAVADRTPLQLLRDWGAATGSSEKAGTPGPLLADWLGPQWPLAHQMN